MKKIILSIALLLIVFTFSCKKYPEGPLISFRTPFARIIGNWQMTEYISNGIDSAQYYNNSLNFHVEIGYRHREEEDKDLNIYLLNENKSFKERMLFSSDRKTLIVDCTDSIFYDNHGVNFFGPFKENTKCNWHILKLTNKEFKMSTDLNGNNYKISFKKL